MREWADFTVHEAGGRTTVKVEGPLLVSTIGLLDRKLREYAEPVQTVDLSAIGDIDTVGAWTVWRFADEHKARITGANEQAGKLLRTVSENASTAPIEPERAPVLTRIAADFGENVIEFGHGVVRFIGFLGAVIAAVGSLFDHPRRFRFKSLVRQFELVGVTAIPIIGLMSFLIGIDIAQQGAAQLRQFGAEQAVCLPMGIPLRLDRGGVESLVQLGAHTGPGLCQRRQGGASRAWRATCRDGILAP